MSGQGQAGMLSSRTLASQFGRDHGKVLRDIRSHLSDLPAEFTRFNFRLGKYRDRSGRSRPEYLMTREGFMFMSLCMTGREAARRKMVFVQAFRAMESVIQGDEDEVVLGDEVIG